MNRIKKIINSKVKIIDLGPDFRIKNLKTFEKTYKIKHTFPAKLAESVYGLPEIYKDKISQANLISNPGCFPTGALLALFPLAKHKLLDHIIVINSATGSSGSGIKPSQTTHHPERANDFKAYNVFSHRHLPEIKQTIEDLQISKSDIVFTAHSAPMVRGIYTTAYIVLRKEITQKEIYNIFSLTYKDSPFIRIVENSRIHSVIGSNYCDISFFVQGKKIIITSSIDNLVKGASGQAIQNMNIMFKLPETTGLINPGIYP